VDARGYLDHLDGTGAEPADPVKDRDVPSLSRTLTADEITAETEWKKELKVWKQGEAVVKQQIAGSIPDSLFMKIRGLPSAREIWKALTNDFQK